jgi:hypothetical protein
MTIRTKIILHTLYILLTTSNASAHDSCLINASNVTLELLLHMKTVIWPYVAHFMKITCFVCISKDTQRLSPRNRPVFEWVKILCSSLCLWVSQNNRGKTPIFIHSGIPKTLYNITRAANFYRSLKTNIVVREVISANLDELICKCSAHRCSCECLLLWFITLLKLGE